LKPYLNVKTKELAVGGAGVWEVIPAAPVPLGNGLAIVRAAFGVETEMQDPDYNFIRSICLSGKSSGVGQIDYTALAIALKAQGAFDLTIVGTARPDTKKATS